MVSSVASARQEPARPDALVVSRYPRFSPDYRERWVSSGLWPDETLHGLFARTVDREPDAAALVHARARWSFEELAEQIDAATRGLASQGVGAGDLVSVVLPNCPEHVVLQVALARLGAVISPLHMSYRRHELAAMIAFCEADVIVTAASHSGHRFIDDVRAARAQAPSVRAVIVVDAGEGVGEALQPDELAWDELLTRGRASPPVMDVDDPDAVCYLNFTSGTTGAPKGFLHTHNTLLSNLKPMAVGARGAMPGTPVLTCSPMSHSFGHFITYLMLIGGLPIVLVDRYDAETVLRLIEAEKVGYLCGTPAHLGGLLDVPAYTSYDTSSIKGVVAGGAPSTPELTKRIGEAWGVGSTNTYGLGENIVHTRTAATDPVEKQRTTVGRAVPGTELRIVDPVTRAALATGEVGEIAFRGPTLFVGYHRNLDRTLATRDDDGWFYTGDLGSVDADGYLTFAGRQGEVINRGGTKIFPPDVEDLVRTHPDVREVAVIGVPDAQLGQRVCAVVTVEDRSRLTLADLAEHLAGQRVSKHKIPEVLHIVDEMPMTPSGKIRKADLTDRFAAEGDEAV